MSDLDNFLSGQNTPEEDSNNKKSDLENFLDTTRHAAEVAGSAVLRGAAAAPGYLVDVLGSLAASADPHATYSGVDTTKMVGRAIGGQGLATTKSDEAAAKAINAPEPRTDLERWLQAAGMGVGGLVVGGEAKLPALVAGAVGGLSGEAGHRLFPNSPVAPAIAGLLGGGAAGAAMHGPSPIARGMSHPEYAMAVDSVIPALEGGGTIEAPKTNPNSGAFGPMQVMPETLRQPGHRIKPWNGTVADSVRVGRELYAALLDKYKGNTEKALAAYNWGEGNLDKAIKKYGDNWLTHAPEETFNYVHNGMQRIYGGNPLRAGSTGGEVPPMDISQLPPDEPRQPIVPDNGEVVPIDEQRARNVVEDQQKLNDFIDNHLGEAHQALDDIRQGYEPDLSSTDVAGFLKGAQEILDGMQKNDPLYNKASKAVELWNNVAAHFEDSSVAPKPEVFGDASDKFLGQKPRGDMPANDPADPTLREDIDRFIKNQLENSDFGRDSRALNDIEAQAESLLQELKDRKISFEEYDARVESLNAARAAILDRFKKNRSDYEASKQEHDASTQKPDVKSSVDTTGRTPPPAANDGSGPPKGPTEPPFGGGGEPPREPPPEPTGDKYAGSINLNRLAISDAAKQNISLMSKPMKMDIETFNESRQRAQELIDDKGVEGVLNINEVKPGDFAHYATAVRAIHAAAQERMLKLNEAFLNPELNSETAHVAWLHARDVLAAAFERNQQIAKGLGRGLGALRIEVGGLEGNLGEKVADLMKTRATDEDIARMIGEHPDQVGRIARDSKKPGWNEVMFTTWYAMLLSSPRTLAKNLLSNTIMNSLDTFLIHPVAAGIGLLHGGQKMTFRAAGAGMGGLARGAIAGFANMGEAYRRGAPSDFAERTQAYWKPENKGIGRVISAPMRVLSAQDQLFLDAAQNAEYYRMAHVKAAEEGLTGQDYRDAVQHYIDNPTAAMDKQAVKYAQMMRFQDPMEFKGLEYATRSTPKDPFMIKLMKGFLRVLFPFPRNSDRMFFAAIRNSPLGVIEPQNLRDFRAGGAKRDVAMARVLVGTAISYGIYQWAANGGITGANPSDPSKKFMINFPGGVHVSYQGLADPFSTTIASIATAVEDAKTGTEDLYGKVFRGTKDLLGVLMNSTWATGASQFFNAADDQTGKTMQAWVGRMASSFTTPSVVREINQDYIDPTVRNTKQNPISDTIKASIPGLSKTLPAKHDVFGDKIVRENPGYMNFINPARVQVDKHPALSSMLADIKSPTPLLSKAPKTVTINGEKKTLSAKGQEKYQAVSGRIFEQMMEQNMWQLQGLSNADKIRLVRKTQSDARKLARQELWGV